MNLAQALMQNGTIDSMADELGVDQATAQKGASALMPAILAGLGRQSAAQAPVAAQPAAFGGLGGILGGLAGGGGASTGAGGLGGLGGVLLDSVLKKQPTPTAPGNDILGEIFGNKDVSRGVAEEAAGSTGLPPELLKKMLPILVTAAVGYMLNKHGSGGANNQAPAPSQSGGGMMGGALGGLLGQIVSGMARR